MAQLQGYRKPDYIAGTNKEAVEKALEVARGTTVGVMDSQGNIIKRSSRKKGQIHTCVRSREVCRANLPLVRAELLQPTDELESQDLVP
jgi:hypothetical protein